MQTALESPAIDRSPEVVVQNLATAFGTVHVVRDDLLTGGTKQRAALPFLAELAASGAREFVYASPFCGFAQVALAASCAALGLASRIYCEATPAGAAAAGGLHEFSILARDLGGSVVCVPSLGDAAREADWYAGGAAERFLIPLGFQHVRFLRHLTARIAEQHTALCRQLGRRPRRIWLPVGSGTLARAFRAATSGDCELIGVDVRVLPPDDPRLGALADDAGFELRRAAELFSEPATVAAPVPSNAHYDAKLWAQISSHGRDGDVWWNVAR